MNKNNSIQIKNFTQNDYDRWLKLWQDYLAFYKTTLSMDIIKSTWQKLHNSDISIYGFGAFKDDVLIAIAHVVLHPNTWNDTECCYLEDLYVDKTVRGQGIGRTLIEHIYDFATLQGCNRVYWTTQEDNTAARILYDTIANKTDMVQYRKNL